MQWLLANILSREIFLPLEEAEKLSFPEKMRPKASYRSHVASVS